MAPVKQQPAKSSQDLSSSARKQVRTQKSKVPESPPDPLLMDAPSSPADPMASSASIPAQEQGEASGRGVRDLLSVFRSDFDSWAVRLEQALRGEVEELRGHITQTDSRMGELTHTVETHSSRLSALEPTLQQQTSDTRELQLCVEDGENRSHHNNIRLRGKPEATQGPDLLSTVSAIFNILLDRPPTTRIEIDRVHRVAGIRPSQSNSG